MGAMGLAASTVEPTPLSELIKPHARQREFFDACKEHRFVLYGGARGGGKSYILRWTLVWFALWLTKLGFRNCILGLFCISYPELRLRQIEPIKREFPEWLGSWNESEKGFRFAEEYGGHLIKCCNLDDPSKYKSAEFAGMAVDELTLLPSKGIFDTLRGSLRWPGLLKPLFIAGTNPDGPGHSWVKRLWVTRDFSHPDDALLPAKEFAFVRSLPTDNPHLSEVYINEELASQPESVRKAWLEGSWDLFEGQRFNVNPAVHVVKPFDLGPLVKYYASMDYGFDNPFAAGIYAVLPKSEHRTFIYKVKEINVKGLKAREQARLVLDTLKFMGIELAAPAYLDTACWKEEDDGLSIATKFQQEGLPVQQVLKDRATGWVAYEDLLAYKSVDGAVTEEPQMKFFDCCPLTVQQTTDAVWDPKKPGDILHGEGFRDDCIAEGSLILTRRGEVPIEHVVAGDEVWTRAGWRKVLKAWMKSPSAEVVEMTLSNGAKLRLTPDHRVLTSEGWKEARETRRNAVYFASCKSNALSLTGFTIGGIQRVHTALTGCTTKLPRLRYARVIAGICTKPFGRKRTGEYLTGAISTIRTATLWIIGWRTLSALLLPNTAESTTPQSEGKRQGRTSPESGHCQRHGILARKGWLGTQSGASLTPSVNQLSAGVCSAERLTERSPQRSPGIALTTARRRLGGLLAWTTSQERAKSAAAPTWRTGTPKQSVATVAAVEPAGYAPVYDLTVEGQHEFYANGVLVHNCLDETRYFALTHVAPPKPPKVVTHDDHMKRVYKLIQQQSRRRR